MSGFDSMPADLYVGVLKRELIALREELKYHHHDDLASWEAMESEVAACTDRGYVDICRRLDALEARARAYQEDGEIAAVGRGCICRWDEDGNPEPTSAQCSIHGLAVGAQEPSVREANAELAAVRGQVNTLIRERDAAQVDLAYLRNASREVQDRHNEHMQNAAGQLLHAHNERDTARAEAERQKRLVGELQDALQSITRLHDEIYHDTCGCKSCQIYRLAKAALTDKDSK